MKKILLLPSTIYVSDELKFELGYIPTAMIPLHGKPVLEHILEKYEKKDGIEKFISCNQGKEKIINYIKNRSLNCEPIEISSSNSLGSSIYNAMKFLKDYLKDSYFFINFADTISEVGEVDYEKNLIMYSIVNDPFRWTSFETKNGKITSIIEKYTVISESPKKIFIGVFGFTDPLKFMSTLKKEINNKEKRREIDPFYSALLNFIKEEPYILKFSKNWIDVGHLDTYYSAKKDFINARVFNYIFVNKKTNILTKKSKNKKKLIDEINWYIKLPKNLQHIVPRIYDYSLDEIDPYIMMEYIGYPFLSDVFLYGSYTLGTWDTIFNSLFTLINEMRKYIFNIDKKNLTKTLEEIYYNKTVKRLKKLKSDKNFEFLFNDEVNINEKNYSSLNHVIEELQAKLLKSDIYNLDKLSIIHGDLCFPNIFFDVRNNIIKLIDPRGRFGGYDIYGDYRYDLAKLRHSVCGYYDFIINDQFKLEIDKKNKMINYILFLEEKHKKITEHFEKKVIQKYGRKINEQIKLIESVLFLSMIPLHSDNITRQYCMAAIGLEKFDTVGF